MKMQITNLKFKLLKKLEELFPIGTRSILWGVHSMLWHPFVVLLGWITLFGLPSLKELLCIIVHDIGYIGMRNIDGIEGITHCQMGAKMAGKLLGERYRELVLHHSRTYCKTFGGAPSKLCWADKVSILYEIQWFYIFRARLSGEIKEWRGVTKDKYPLDMSDKEWLKSITIENIGSMPDEMKTKLPKLLLKLKGIRRG